jgi:hypothetical protein
MSEYERIRENNIKERLALFRELGLGPMSRDLEIPTKRTPRMKKPHMMPAKRSARLNTSLPETDTMSVDDPAAIPEADLPEADADADADVVAEADVDDLPASKGFDCNQCPHSFRDNYNLGRHINKMHQLGTYSCPRAFCHEVLPTRWEKQQHVSNCFLICKRCGKKCDREPKFEEHKRFHKTQDARMQ